MSRIRKAAITAGFIYAQYGFAIATGLLLVPLTLHRVGARPWGLWLASGELLGHAGMVELGVIGVLPWMLAEADGRQDRQAMRRLVGDGFWVCTGVGLAYVALALLVWRVFPTALRLTDADRAMLAVPLALVVISNAVSYPLRVFRAVLIGLQDAQFGGMLVLVNGFLEVTITAVLVIKGYGLYALSLGASIPPLIVLAVTVGRVIVLAPDLLRGWEWPSIAHVRSLFTNGAGVWLATLGWQLLAATNAMVITYLGYPEWVPVYSCTAKLGIVSTQLGWVLPDSGLVGLAQLSGEPDSKPRVRHMVMMLLRLHLLLAGGAVCGFLALNPAFVTRWVGPSFFGGLTLNMALAAGIFCASLIHGLITTASLLGNRLKVGVATLVNGVVQTILALVMGRFWGLTGIAVASLIAGALTTLPAGLRLVGPATDLTLEQLVANVLWPWGSRFVPFAMAAAATGVFYRPFGLWRSVAVTVGICLVYVWRMRPLYVGLPLDQQWVRWLVRFRLMPSADPAPVVAMADPT